LPRTLNYLLFDSISLSTRTLKRIDREGPLKKEKKIFFKYIGNGKTDKNLQSTLT